jgi:HEAT repeat protein
MRTTAVVACLLTAAAALSQPEPSYNGKTLSEWVELMNRNPGDHEAARTLGKMGEAAIQALIQAMRTHPDGAIRWIAHESLAEIGRPALPELDKVMQDGDPTARMQAVLCFELILGREAIPRLKAALRDEHPFPRIRAHGALLRLGEPPQEHLPAMIEPLRDPKLGAQWLAAEALGMCGPKAAGAEEALAEVARAFPGGIGDRAWRALEEIGTEAAMAQLNDHWAEELGNPQGDLKTRVAAAVRLGKTGPEVAGALPHLRAVVADADADILLRGYCAWAADQIERSAAPARTYHVAQQHPDADDAHPGTERRPWSTIQRAAETLKPGDTLLIHAGEYREFVRPFLGGTGEERTITYAAAPGEQPVIKASDVWRADWRDEGGGVWSAAYERHPWDHPEQWPTPKEGPMHRAEQVFVDGKLLTHVATMQELRAEAGRMLTDDDAGRLLVHIDGAPADHVIERAMRQQCFAPAVRGLGYIHVRGLRMLHGAAPESNGDNWGVIGHRAVMSTRSGHHWVIEDNVIEWGNAQGLDIGAEGWGEDLTWQPVVCEKSGFHQVRRNVVSHHGVAGIVGWNGGANGLLLEDNVTNDNCLKGNFFMYESAGVKLHTAKDCIIRRHRSHGNHCFGIWLDYNCERNRITQCLLTDNMGAGVFHEVSPGPILIDNNVILGTRNAGDAWGEGVYSHDGNHGTVANNVIAHCANFGIRFRNLFSRVADGKPTTTSHNRFVNNFIFDCERGCVSLNPEVPKAEDNRSDHNVLWQKGSDVTMCLEDAGSGVKWEETKIGQHLQKTGGGDLSVPLQDWQDWVGEDEHSVALPPTLLLRRRSPSQLLETPENLWPADAPPLDGGYGEYEPQPLGDLVAKLVPKLKGYRFAHRIPLGPDFGVQLWQRGDDMLELHWRANDGEIKRLSDPVLRNAPLRPADDVLEVAAGGELVLEADPGLRVVMAGLPTGVKGGKLTIRALADTPPGLYGVVTTMGEHWQWGGVRVGAGR